MQRSCTAANVSSPSCPEKGSASFASRFPARKATSSSIVGYALETAGKPISREGGQHDGRVRKRNEVADEKALRKAIRLFSQQGFAATSTDDLKALFDVDYRTIVLDLRDVRLADRDAVKFLRDCEADGMKAGELSGVRPRVDGKGKRLGAPRTGNPDLREEVYGSGEYIVFGAE